MDKYIEDVKDSFEKDKMKEEFDRTMKFVKNIFHMDLQNQLTQNLRPGCVLKQLLLEWH